MNPLLFNTLDVHKRTLDFEIEILDRTPKSKSKNPVSVHDVYLPFNALCKYGLLVDTWAELDFIGSRSCLVCIQELTADENVEVLENEPIPMTISPFIAHNLGIDSRIDTNRLYEMTLSVVQSLEKLNLAQEVFVSFFDHKVTLTPIPCKPLFPMFNSSYVSPDVVKKSQVSFLHNCQTRIKMFKILYEGMIIGIPVHPIGPKSEMQVVFYEVSKIKQAQSMQNALAYSDITEKRIQAKYSVLHMKTTQVIFLPTLSEKSFDKISIIQRKMSKYLNAEHSYAIPAPYSAKILFPSTYQEILKFLAIGENIPSDYFCQLLLFGSSGNSKQMILQAISEKLQIEYYHVDCFSLADANENSSMKQLAKYISNLVKFTPCILNLRNIHAFDAISRSSFGKVNYISTHLNRIFHRLSKLTARHGIIIVGTTEDESALPVSIRACFLAEFKNLPIPKQTRFNFFQDRFHSTVLASLFEADSKMVDEVCTYLASNTAGYSILNMHELVSVAVSELNLAKEKQEKPTEEKLPDMLTLFSEAIRKFRKLQGFEKGMVTEVPNVKWKDVGGLKAVKHDVLELVQLPLKYPQLFSKFQRSGLLLFGPPGTGKTLVAKAIATECSINFLSVKGPELLNMYVGESEKNIRKLFEKGFVPLTPSTFHLLPLARESKPCVIFFDELDSIAPSRGGGADGGRVMDRIVSALLSELDGANKSTDVFVIGATNRPDLLDSALLRPGRFDKSVYLGVARTNDEQLAVIQALTRKFQLDKDLDLMSDVVEHLPFLLSGADMYALCSDAMLFSQKRIVNIVSREAQECLDVFLKEHPDSKKEFNEAVSETLRKYSHEKISKMRVVTKADFEKARATLTPSLSEEDLRHYRELRKRFAHNAESE